MAREPSRFSGRGAPSPLTKIDSLGHFASSHREQNGPTAVLTGLGRGGQDGAVAPQSCPTLARLSAPHTPPTSWYFSRATLVSAPSWVSMKSSLFL